MHSTFVNDVIEQAGSLSEEQFAENLEHDLNSPHQPNLLPFLKVYINILCNVWTFGHVENQNVTTLYHTYITVIIIHRKHR